MASVPSVSSTSRGCVAATGCRPRLGRCGSYPGAGLLDVYWDHCDLVVEIDGGHHAQALHPVMDALRQNEIVLTRNTVLRIPLLGLRLDEATFMGQVARALATVPSRRG